MAKAKFVGRQEETVRLQAVLKGELAAGRRLVVQSIEGPGGIGKTSCYDHALESVDLSGRQYLSMRISGQSSVPGSVARAVTQLIETAEADALRGQPAGRYFPSVSRVVKVMEYLRAEALAQFLTLPSQNEDGKVAVAEYIDMAFSLGHVVNDLAPKTKGYFNAEAMEKHRPMIEAAIPKLTALVKETPNYFQRLGIVDGMLGLRNKIRHNACELLAEAFVSDLAAILSGYRYRDLFKPSHRKIDSIDRLLLVIDDYEETQRYLGEFLVTYVLPALRNAKFETVVIVLGRDQLEATHVGWSHHHKPVLLEPIVLKPLARDEMDVLVESFGMGSPAEKERAWKDTRGYPLYVQLWSEEAQSGGRSAIVVKRFYDRTTRWMSKQEKRWLEDTLFLDEVDKRTLRKALGSTEEAEKAFRWFENDGSVRDTTSDRFRVREYLRSRLKDYIRISDPDRYEELERKAKAISLELSRPEKP